MLRWRRDREDAMRLLTASAMARRMFTRCDDICEQADVNARYARPSYRASVIIVTLLRYCHAPQKTRENDDCKEARVAIRAIRAVMREQAIDRHTGDEEMSVARKSGCGKISARREATMRAAH